MDPQELHSAPKPEEPEVLAWQPISEEAWKDLCRTWERMVGSEAFKPNSVIQFLHKDSKTLRYGKVDRVVSSTEAFVQIADGVFLLLKAGNAVWSFVPDESLDGAQAIVYTCMPVAQILALTSIEGVKLIVLGASAQGLGGAAAVTSGLATLGGGSVASGGMGMAGGIVVVAAAPSMLAAHTLYNLSSALENNSYTPTAVAIGGAGGAVGGATVGIIMVSEAGIAGLSASGITSGLASLGGGSIAAGGLGMLGGVAAVAATATGVTAVVGLAVWGIAHFVVQGKLQEQRVWLLDKAAELGFERCMG